MNAIAEPIELLEAECNGQACLPHLFAQLEPSAPDDARGTRVLDWMVYRLCGTQDPLEQVYRTAGAVA